MEKFTDSLELLWRLKCPNTNLEIKYNWSTTTDVATHSPVVSIYGKMTCVHVHCTCTLTIVSYINITISSAHLHKIYSVLLPVQIMFELEILHINGGVLGVGHWGLVVLPWVYCASEREISLHDSCMQNLRNDKQNVATCSSYYNSVLTSSLWFLTLLVYEERCWLSKVISTWFGLGHLSPWVISRMYSTRALPSFGFHVCGSANWLARTDTTMRVFSYVH